MSVGRGGPTPPTRAPTGGILGGKRRWIRSSHADQRKIDASSDHLLSFFKPRKGPDGANYGKGREKRSTKKKVESQKGHEKRKDPKTQTPFPVKILLEEKVENNPYENRGKGRMSSVGIGRCSEWKNFAECWAVGK